MPCICGQKVDRQDANKLACIICKQYVHIKCFNIKLSDVDLFKNKFKCKQCLSIRRASLCSSPVLVSAPLSTRSAGNLDAVLTPGIQPSLASAASSSKDAVSHKDVVVGAKLPPSEIVVDVNSLSDKASAKSSVTLDDVFYEVTALRSIIISLSEENTLLTKKVSDLELAVKTLQVSLPNDIAKKCTSQKQVAGAKVGSSLINKTVTKIASVPVLNVERGCILSTVSSTNTPSSNNLNTGLTGLPIALNENCLSSAESKRSLPAAETASIVPATVSVNCSRASSSSPAAAVITNTGLPIDIYVTM